MWKKHMFCFFSEAMQGMTKDAGFIDFWKKYPATLQE